MLRRRSSTGWISDLLAAGADLLAAGAVTLAVAVPGIACSGGGAADGGQSPAVRGPLPDRYVLQFDGINDYASMGTASFPKTMQTQTYSLWVNYMQNDPFQTFVVLKKYLISGVHFGVHAGRLAAWRTSDQALLVEGPVLTERTWHHVAYTFDGTNQHTLFIDGLQVATGAAAIDTKLNISAYLGTFDGASQMFKGQMDNVRIWTVVRTAAELATEMRGELPAAPPGLSAWWGFDEDSGGLAYDYTGHGDTCTLGDGDPTRMPIRVPSTLSLPRVDAGND